MRSFLIHRNGLAGKVHSSGANILLSFNLNNYLLQRQIITSDCSLNVNENGSFIFIDHILWGIEP
jgi:hypothetical protein